MVSQFMLLFMLIPVAIPGVIAAYSIVGEKTTRSLEPLLATPITTIELLVGKCLAAVIPAIITTYGAYAIFTLGASILVTNRRLLSAFFEPRWLIAILVVGPLLAILATTFALMVSSRVNDPRVAEQISMVIIIPVLGGFFWTSVWPFCTQYPTHQYCCVCDVGIGCLDDISGFPGI